MANIGKNGQISPPITLLLFKLHQHNVPQKNTFFICNWDLIEKNIVQSQKFEKSQSFFFALFYIGVT